MMGRTPLFKSAMSDAERQRRTRARRTPTATVRDGEVVLSFADVEKTLSADAAVDLAFALINAARRSHPKR